MLLASRRALLTLGLIVACAGALVTSASAAPPSKRPITKLSYDPSLPKVELFEGIESGTLEARLVAKNQFGGNVLITNTSKTPVSVQIPESVVGVQVFPQMMGGMGGMGGGMGGMGGGMGGMGGGMGGMGGGMQSMGGGMGGGMGGMGGGMGGMGGGMGGMGGGMGGGGGFFSIPAERTISVPMQSICLEHGKANPTSAATYRLVRTSDYSDKPELQQLLKQVSFGKLERGTAQAAAWNIAGGLSWEQLAAEKWDRLGAPDAPYFSPAQLAAARMVVADAQAQARIAAEKGVKKEEKARPSRVGQVPAAVSTGSQN